jgi:hypothetical protein
MISGGNKVRNLLENTDKAHIECHWKRRPSVDERFYVIFLHVITDAAVSPKKKIVYRKLAKCIGPFIFTCITKWCGVTTIKGDAGTIRYNLNDWYSFLSNMIRDSMRTTMDQITMLMVHCCTAMNHMQKRVIFVEVLNSTGSLRLDAVSVLTFHGTRRKGNQYYENKWKAVAHFNVQVGLAVAECGNQDSHLCVSTNTHRLMDMTARRRRQITAMFQRRSSASSCVQSYRIYPIKDFSLADDVSRNQYQRRMRL